MCKTKCATAPHCKWGSFWSSSHPCKGGCQNPVEVVGEQAIGAAVNEPVINFITSSEPGFIPAIPEIKLPEFFESTKDAAVKVMQQHQDYGSAFGKTVIIDEQDSVYRSKLNFEEWYNKFEEEIDIELAETGADREMDFDREKEYEKRYDKYLLGPSVHDKAWAAWQADQMDNMVDVNAAAYVKGYKVGYEATRKKYDSAEVYLLLKKLLADHPLHRGIQITPMMVLKWFEKNKKK
jgi:hypothetical protein